MTTDKDDEEEGVLNYFRERYGWMIAWEFDDGPGMYLGESGGGPEHKIAADAAKEIGSPSKSEFGRLEWESERLVRKALAAAKAAIKAYQDGNPLPDWALKATAEGWKPPKGWKPR